MDYIYPKKSNISQLINNEKSTFVNITVFVELALFEVNNQIFTY